MVTKLFLDTNILLDVLDSKRPHHTASVQIFEKIEEKSLMAFISESVICNADYILQKSWPKEYRSSFFSEISQIIGLLTINQKVLNLALSSSLKDLEDAIIYYMAIENELQFMITNDLDLINYSQNKTLKCITPSDFLMLTI